MARWYKIIVGGTTFDATTNPNALQVELDITVAQFAVPHPGQAAWCRVWGIPLQTVLTANQFTNKQIQVYVFRPGICWSGLVLNLCGSEVQALPMNSYGVRPLRVLSLLAKL